MTLRFTRPARLALLVTAVTSVGLNQAGCMTMPFVPGAQISFNQLFDQPNFTVQFSVEDAVADSSTISSVNWVFGDAMGFVTGGATIDHRYDATGNYDVQAYVFVGGELIGTLERSITVFAGQKAVNPNPAIGATNVSLGASLSWSAGAGEPQHDVYLGTDSAAVAAATSASPEFQRRQGGTSFAPAALLGGTTYFWRIDEVTASSTTKGDVWSFTTLAAPGAISNIMPADDATGVPLSVILDWDAGSNATSHDVYFGSNSFAVDNANPTDSEFRGNQSATQFDPADLMPDVEYFWRIDERGPGGVLRGALLSFRTEPLPGAAANFNPPNASTNIALDIELTWDAGTNTTSHDVYLGTDENAVNDATTNSAQFEGNQGETTFDPDNLLPNVNYFWRIDEANSAGRTKGSVRRFRTSPAPGEATEPVPADDEIAVSLNPMLMWDAGSNTTSHDVYFGANEVDVMNATTNSAEFEGNQAGTSFAPDGPLAMDTQYFWRIDERGPGGVTRGDLFSFTTIDERMASNPTPADEAMSVALNSVLMWTSGTGSPTHDVYLSTNLQAVETANNTAGNAFRGNFTDPMYTPPSLDAGATYFWRIDEVYAVDDVVRGVIWEFTTAPSPPEKAENPSPAIAATNIGLTPTLTWTAGELAESHDVYLGTDMMAVMNATRMTAGIFRGNRPNANINPGPLERATTYYWRIDEVNDAGTTAGDLWSFTTIPEIPSKISAAMPAGGATGLNINSPDPGLTVLSWTSGTGTGPITHDVYFGTSMTAVQDATTNSAQFEGNQPGVTFNPGVLTAFTNYFWRIDEVNAGGVQKGDVLMFQTAPVPVAATSPMPANTVVNVALPVMLSWTSDMAVTAHDVYFGTVESAVDNATRVSNPQFRGTLAAGNTTFGDAMMTETFGVTIMGDVQYFWRIDEVGPGGITKGAVWTFRTVPLPPGMPNNPSPANGATGTPTSGSTLSWTAATGATEYRVFYGTNQMLVTNKDMSVDQGVTMNTSISTGARVANTDYFWRVVAINATGETDGPVWTFKTMP